MGAMEGTKSVLTIGLSRAVATPNGFSMGQSTTTILGESTMDELLKTNKDLIEGFITKDMTDDQIEAYKRDQGFLLAGNLKAITDQDKDTAGHDFNADPSWALQLESTLESQSEDLQETVLFMITFSLAQSL